MKKIIAIVLLAAGVYGGYKGYEIINDSSKGIEIGNLEIKAEDKDSRTTGYLYAGLGLVGIIAGAAMMFQKK